MSLNPSLSNAFENPGSKYARKEMALFVPVAMSCSKYAGKGMAVFDPVAISCSKYASKEMAVFALVAISCSKYIRKEVAPFGSVAIFYFLTKLEIDFLPKVCWGGSVIMCNYRK